jgi:hypothetical protein
VSASAGYRRDHFCDAIVADWQSTGGNQIRAELEQAVATR